MRKCCIIYNEPGKDALADELDVLDQVSHIEKHLLLLGINVHRKGITGNFMEEISSLIPQKYDFVYNLVETINNKGEINYFIPALLNLYSIPYAGNPLEAIFYTSNKTISSRMMKAAGINNPLCYLPSQWNLLIPGKKYIVKPIWEDGSLGINGDAVFEYQQGVEERFKVLDDAHWFIEDFIDGREFNMSVLAGNNGPEIMPPAEIVFKNFSDDKPKIVDFKAKWEMESFEYENTVREFPGKDIDPEFEARLKDVALKCWHLFRMKGYARVDVRVDKNGNIFVIEINANPCISPDGGFVAATREGGYSFIEVIQHIINDLN
jgi:D-alanine-D-alanine ligase